MGQHLTRVGSDVDLLNGIRRCLFVLIAGIFLLRRRSKARKFADTFKRNSSTCHPRDSKYGEAANGLAYSGGVQRL